MAQPKNKMLDCWCQKQEARTMIANLARMRIAKIRDELSRSIENLNNKLGLINEKEDSVSTINEYACWLEIR